MFLEILKQIPNFDTKQIKKMTRISQGYCNQCFKIVLNDNQQFFFRKAKHNPEISRKQEYYIEKLINDPYFVWYDSKNGNMLKKYVVGKTTFYWSKDLLKKLVETVKKTHSLNYDAKKVLDQANLIDAKIVGEKIYKEYMELINKYENLPKYLCHNDLNIGNIMLLNNHQLYIFDWEWARINSAYWDLANFSRESLNKNQIKFLVETYGNLDLKIFHDFLLITSYYALYWAINQEQNKKIIAYREKIKSRITIIKKFNFSD